MCRWLMYHGKPLLMSKLLVEPENSLIHQSIHSYQGKTDVNGDGFGLGWYSDANSGPGQYRDNLPAWNDSNFRSIAEHIVSPTFLAHIRATTGTPSMRTNCHPFRYKNILFMHNGAIGSFSHIRYDLERLIGKEYYKLRLGCTDTEALFLLALTNGLEHSPQIAIEKTIEQIAKVQEANGVPVEFRGTLAFSNGNASCATKFSNTDVVPSLYYVVDDGINEVIGQSANLNDFSQSTLILSEPLNHSEVYHEVHNHDFLIVDHRNMRIKTKLWQS